MRIISEWSSYGRKRVFTLGEVGKETVSSICVRRMDLSSAGDKGNDQKGDMIICIVNVV